MPMPCRAFQSRGYMRAMAGRVFLAVPAAVSLSLVLWSSPGTAILAVLLTATFALLVTPV